ncbi:hypothetical protein C4X99_13035 [Leptospira interrogans serovar Geyaweera]|nr:hypothetical protein C4X99_13035 [Leptospira interrogans serovar Geyaweera]
MKVKINKTASIDFSIKQKQMEDSFFHNSIVNKLYIDTANFYHKICLRVTASHLSYEIRELNYYDLKCLFAKIFLY